MMHIISCIIDKYPAGCAPTPSIRVPDENGMNLKFHGFTINNRIQTGESFMSYRIQFFALKICFILQTRKLSAYNKQHMGHMLHIYIIYPSCIRHINVIYPSYIRYIPGVTQVVT